MAETKINTRIILRNADLSAWETSKVTLLLGEMALARLSGGLSNNYSVRIGTGDKKWSELSDQGQLIIPVANVEGLDDEIQQLSTGLSNSLSVTVEALETAESGYLSSYVIKQGGNQVGATINIPKDKVFESAYMVNVSCEPADATKETVSAFVVSYDTTVVHVLSDDTAVEPEVTIAKGTFESIRNAYYGKEGGAGPYLRVTVSHQDCPLYIAMPKVVDTYVGGNTDTISVNVENRTITAVVRDSSIGAAQIKDGEIIGVKIADDAVTNAKIADNAVDTAQLCANAVTTEKIADGNVTKVKLASEVSDWVEGRVSATLSDANAYTDSVISGLDADSFEGAQDKTLKYIKQTDGKISAEYQDIAIGQAAVTGLGDDLDEIRANLSGDGDGSVNDRISTLCSDLSGAVDARLGDLSSTVDARFVQLSSVKDSDQISETNLIVTEKDIAALTGVMHFKGVAISTALSTGSTVIPKPPYKDGETPISGDFVIDKDGTEFVWAVSTDTDQTQCWFKVGDETLYAKKTDLELEVSARISSDEVILSTVSAISSQIEAEIAAETAARSDADSAISAALSADYTGKIDDEKAAREDYDLYISSQVSAVIANYLSSVVFNNITCDITNHSAVFQISCIDCGGAD